jgi:transposase
VGEERTVQTFEGFFALIGQPLASQIEFVCSDMWKPYLRVIRDKCSQALHILDRFHIVAKMNEALDDVRAAESRKMAQEGHQPLVEEVPLVCPQAQRESHQRAKASIAGSASL